jgi:hypothetical protein
MSVTVAHPCETDPGEFDHDWQFQDDSFDHEYGTEQVHYWLCQRCGALRDMESEDYSWEDE